MTMQNQVIAFDKKEIRMNLTQSLRKIMLNKYYFIPSKKRKLYALE